MGFRAEDLTMADVYAIEDLIGGPMTTWIQSGSLKVPFVLAWRVECQNGRPGLTFDQFATENSHLTLEAVAEQFGIDTTDGDDETDPTVGTGPSPSPGSVTDGE